MLFFQWGKEGALLFNYNGFTLIEVLISSSIVFLLVTIIIPITTLLHQERSVLNHRRIASSELHDELQKFIWTDSMITSSYSKSIQTNHYYFNFVTEEELIKGCVTWENVRKVEEMFCLYGMVKK